MKEKLYVHHLPLSGMGSLRYGIRNSVELWYNELIIAVHFKISTLRWSSKWEGNKVTFIAKKLHDNDSGPGSILVSCWLA